MANLLFMFIAKVMDSLVVSLSHIYTYKNKKYIASILTMLSVAIFFSIVSKFIQTNTWQSLLILAFASGVGKYLSMQMDNKLTRDNSWLTIVKYKGDKSDLQAHIDEMRDNGKTVFSVPAHYNNKGGSTLMLFIINEDRDTSKMVKSIMPKQATIISTELKEYY